MHESRCASKKLLMIPQYWDCDEEARYAWLDFFQEHNVGLDADYDEPFGPMDGDTFLRDASDFTEKEIKAACFLGGEVIDGYEMPYKPFGYPLKTDDYSGWPDTDLAYTPHHMAEYFCRRLRSPRRAILVGNMPLFYCDSALSGINIDVHFPFDSNRCSLEALTELQHAALWHRADCIILQEIPVELAIEFVELATEKVKSLPPFVVPVGVLVGYTTGPSIRWIF